LIGRGREKVLDDAKAMRAIEADKVKARLLGALEGIAMPAPEIANVLLVHRPRLHRIIGKGADRQSRGPAWHLFGIEVRAIDAGISELDTGKRAILMHRLRHLRQSGDIRIIP